VKREEKTVTNLQEVPDLILNPIADQSQVKKSVLGIRDIQILICPDPTSFFIDLNDAKKIICFHIFSS
jgi:hypothetical protein